MSGNENQIAVGRSLAIPLQVVFRLDRLPVFVHAQNCEIEVISRKREIVWIAAEECHLLLRREYKTHVGIFLIAIEPILAALVERHDIGSEARLVEALFRNLGL